MSDCVSKLKFNSMMKGKWKNRNINHSVETSPIHKQQHFSNIQHKLNPAATKSVP